MKSRRSERAHFRPPLEMKKWFNGNESTSQTFPAFPPLAGPAPNMSDFVSVRPPTMEPSKKCPLSFRFAVRSILSRHPCDTESDSFSTHTHPDTLLMLCTHTEWCLCALLIYLHPCTLNVLLQLLGIHLMLAPSTLSLSRQFASAAPFISSQSKWIPALSRCFVRDSPNNSDPHTMKTNIFGVYTPNPGEMRSTRISAALRRVHSSGPFDRISNSILNNK